MRSRFEHLCANSIVLVRVLLVIPISISPCRNFIRREIVYNIEEKGINVAICDLRFGTSSL